jgi:transcriptional regulator with XRE-family HTH domain
MLIILIIMLSRNLSLRQKFADNLKKIRLEKGFSQEALADLAGLHRTYIGSVERGERNISIDNIERIAKALGCDPNNLIKREIS